MPCAICNKAFKIGKDGKEKCVEIGSHTLCMNKACWAASRTQQGMDERKIEASTFIKPDWGGAL